MSIIKKIKNNFNPESSLSTPEKWLVEMLGNDAGKLTEDTALQVTACFACVRLISEQIASLPFGLYEKAEDKGRIKRVDHELYRIINEEPNPYMTAYNFWKAILINYLLTGFGYAEIERERKTRRVKALWPIPTKYVTKSKNKRGEPVYEVKIKREDEPKGISHGNMLEIQGLTPDGYNVYEPLTLLKNAIGLSRAAEGYSNEYFTEGTHPSGTITYPGSLKGERREEFKKNVKAAYGGLGKHHRVMLLEEGMKFDRITAPPNEGQMFESRKFQVIEIARFFNVPPPKIMEMDRATYNNIEEMNINFVNDSLLPHCTNIEQAVNQVCLFNYEKKEGMYSEFDLNGLLRGRMEDRFNSYAKARQWGWLNVNEIRAKENMTGIGPAGDVYLEPMNMRDAEKGGNE